MWGEMCGLVRERGAAFALWHEGESLRGGGCECARASVSSSRVDGLGAAFAVVRGQPMLVPWQLCAPRAVCVYVSGRSSQVLMLRPCACGVFVCESRFPCCASEP